MRKSLNLFFLLATLLFFAEADAQCTVTLSPNTSPLCVANGTTTTLTATYSSAPATGYQWYLNGNAISGATNATYSVSSAGSYWVTATNGSCSATSGSVLVSYYTPVVFSQNTFNVCSGQVFILCPVAGPYYTYQWQVNGVNIAGATGSGYSATASGIYTVTVINANGNPGTLCPVVSNPVTVNYLPAPPATITAFPDTPCQGGTATFCAPPGSTLHYNWSLAGASAYAWTPSCIAANVFSNSSVVVQLHVTDSATGCDATSTDTITVRPAPAVPVAGSNSPIAIGDTVMLNAQSSTAGVTYNWTGPNAYTSNLQNPEIYNAAGSMSGSYIVYASQNGCNSPYAFVPVTVTDFVWPGDANYDHVVDNTDVLSIALTYNYTGPARNNASMSWTPQVCSNWSTSLPGNINMKHADCNGDSTVNDNDTLAVSLNYGQVHARPAHHAQAKVAGLPDLYFDTDGISFAPGTTVSVPIKLGSTSVPMNNLMGLAAQVKISGIALNTPPRIQYNTSWLAANSQAVKFSKAQGNNQLDWTYARNDHQNISGNGTIATLVFDIPANASATPAVLYFDDVILIDHNGNYITGFNALDDSVLVAPLNILCCGPLTEQASILPNPSRGAALLEFNLSRAGTMELQITDIAGKTVSEQHLQCASGIQQVQLPGAQVVPGIYNVTISSGGQPVQTIKWVKEN
ncbi:T9SS type A sorting domain-containing protein [Chitinophagaceae bacterium MMS25-I14]